MRILLYKATGVWKLIVLFFLILLTFSYAMFQGGFVSWFLFYSFIPFALYSLAISLYSIKDVSVKRVFSKTDYNAGENLKMRVQIERNRPFPLFYMVASDSLNELLSQSMKIGKANTILFPGFQKSFKFEYEITKLPRGEHFFQSVRLKTGDLLGLIEKEELLEVQDRIIVYPAYEEMIYRPLENHYDQGMTASKERVQRDTTMAIGVREYQPGDRFSWINWKATAKRNDIMTKEFEQRQSHDVYIIMDCAADHRFEVIVSFTASIIRAILKKGAQVGLLTTGSDRASFPIRGGEGHQQALFYHLAKVKDDSQIGVDRVIEGESFLLQQNVSLVVVTAQLSKRVIEKAGYLAQKSGSVILFLIKKENESPSKNELSFKAAANARGVHVILVHEGNFSGAFSEVSRR